MGDRSGFAIISKRYKEAHPRCEMCGELATEVHHIVPFSLGGSNDESNLRSLCDDCHKRVHKIKKTDQR